MAGEKDNLNHSVSGQCRVVAGYTYEWESKGQYRDGKIQYCQNQIAKSDRNSGIRKADQETAERLIRNTYYVLLTRGMLGTYVYCEDEGLRNHLKEMLIESKQ